MNHSCFIKYCKTKLGKQIYKCRFCNKYFQEGDKREKYSENIKEMAFVLYTEGNGFRRIGRILSKIFNQKIYYQTVYKCLKSRQSELKVIKKTEEDIEIIEADELLTYIKKIKFNPNLDCYGRQPDASV